MPKGCLCAVHNPHCCMYPGPTPAENSSSMSLVTCCFANLMTFSFSLPSFTRHCEALLQPYNLYRIEGNRPTQSKDVSGRLLRSLISYYRNPSLKPVLYYNLPQMLPGVFLLSFSWSPPGSSFLSPKSFCSLLLPSACPFIAA